MTNIEKETLSDGFRICLLGVDADARRNTLEFRAVLFDGGREVGSVTYRGSCYDIPVSDTNALRSKIAKVAAAPHVLAVFGSGCPLTAMPEAEISTVSPGHAITGLMRGENPSGQVRMGTR